MKDKKIVLTTMPSEGEYINWTTHKYFAPKAERYLPLGILSLASNLPSNLEVKILDAASEGWSINETIERINLEEPDIVGLSIITRRVYAMNPILRGVRAGYKVVGGPHATYYAPQIIESGADAVFIGQLADNEFKEAVQNEPRGIIECRTEINTINFPKRELLDIKKYFPQVSILFKANKRLPMFSSVGCPNRCNFCDVQSKRVQWKNPKLVLDEMEYLLSIGCGSIHVLDDNFNINAGHVRGILDEMDLRGFYNEWSGRGQIRTNLELVRRLAEHGFKRIHVGFEALDENILEFFNKRQKVSDIERFCKTMTDNGVDILGYFISGSPVETEEYRKSLPGRIRQLGIKYPFFNLLFPEPNTEYYRQLLAEGTYKKDYWAEYMQNPTPDFEIPYPYGEARKKEILAYNESLVEEFKKK